MKLYIEYLNILNEVGEVENAWFTTFNLDPELLDRFLLPMLINEKVEQPKTTEDFEVLNFALKDIDVKIWYDFRALNTSIAKKTTVDLIPVNLAEFYNIKETDAIFHPKVIFIKGSKAAYLITGSANLSISAWSTNRESVSIKKIEDKENALNVLKFFELLNKKPNTKLNKWAQSLMTKKTDWKFIYSLNNKFNLFDYLKGDELIMWAPYFSKKTNLLLDKIIDFGFKHIKMVPDVDDFDKVGIINEELEKIKNSKNISVCTDNYNKEKQSRSHAKVWLTKNKIAIGSWNCSFRATGIDINPEKQNVEAGVVEDIDLQTYNELQKSFKVVDVQKDIKGKELTEIDKDLEELLRKYTVSLMVFANWENFTYQLGECNLNLSDYSIELPDNYGNSIKLNELNGTSFRKTFKSILKNKMYRVFDKNSELVYEGYLIEKGKAKRPVYTYDNLPDLFQSLLLNPEGELPTKRCSYIFEGDPDEYSDEFNSSAKYSGVDSYYLMFVSFQRFYDSLKNASDKPEELDKLVFRLPGSLTNIIELVNKSLSETETSTEQDTLLYNYFLVCELNRCIKLFNNIYNSKEKFKIIDTENLGKRIDFREEDKKFLKSLNQRTGYEL